MTMRGNQRLRDVMRGNFARNFPDLATIWRPETITTPDFGEETVYTEIGQVEANWWSMSGREAMVLESIGINAEGTVSLPATPVITDINELDEIVYEVAETGKIHHFQVMFVYDRSQPHDVRVAVVEMKFEEE